MTRRYQVDAGVSSGILTVSEGGVILSTPLALSHLYGRLFVNFEAQAKKNGWTVTPLEEEAPDGH